MHNPSCLERYRAGIRRSGISTGIEFKRISHKEVDIMEYKMSQVVTSFYNVDRTRVLGSITRQRNFIKKRTVFFLRNTGLTFDKISQELNKILGCKVYDRERIRQIYLSAKRDKSIAKLLNNE